MEDKNERIINDAIKLFINRGIIGVTMDELAKTAGMSKKTVYQYFKNKETLVEAVVDQLIGETKHIISSNTRASDNPVQELVLQQDLFKHLITFRYLFNDLLLRRYPRALRVLHEFKREYLKMVIESNFSDGVKKGLYLSNLDVPGTAAIYLSVTDFFLLHSLRTQAEIFKVLQIFIKGIATNDGCRVLAEHSK